MKKKKLMFVGETTIYENFGTCIRVFDLFIFRVYLTLDSKEVDVYRRDRRRDNHI